MNADDHELLRRYAGQQDETAFTELVRRHLNLVWGAARRITNDADLARDVAQTVFTDLARKASHLPHGTVLAGWLYRAACLAAAKAVRGNARRAEREKQAMELHALHAVDSADARAADSLQPWLDEALGQLADTDRDAIVLRYFARKNFAEVGAALGTSDDAAQKRLTRALEKLRSHFRRRGMSASAGAIVVALGVASAQAAPAGLAASVAAASLVAASAAATSVGILQTLTLMKTKLALSALAIAAVAVPVAYQQKTVAQLRAQNEALQQQVAQLAVRAPANASELQTAADMSEVERLRAEHTELLQLRGEVGRLRKQVAQQSSGTQEELNGALAAAKAAEEKAVEHASILQAEALSVKTVNSMKRLGLAAHIFANDHQDKLPTSFEEMKNQLGGLPTDRFEFVKHIREITIREPELILFREIEPRSMPDGSWERVYTFVDHSVQKINSPNADFSAFEQEHMAKPLAAQETNRQ